MFGVKWIQFIDSGGQLQYHDILPLFVQNTSVTIFVVKLSEELSHRPTIEYYGADGKPVGKLCRSSLSHKQILQHCLGAIHSQDACPLIVTVGTHQDAESEYSESIKEKNLQLKVLLDPNHYRHVLYIGEGMNELIFAVNGLSPEDVDRRVAQVLRKEIVSKLPQQLVKQPIAWFGLEIVLQRSSHDGVLSLAECQGCAKRLRIEGDAFSAALHHLVHNNVFLYYPEVLPQTVFCDPQVVLTKMTELVQYNHKLRDNPDKRVAVTGDWIMFRDHGLLTVELLRKFTKHYKEGLFAPQDLLELLVSVRAIAKIRDGEYLMPALLPHLDSTQVSRFYQQSTSLIICRPIQGCIPSGLFCCLVAHLLSPTNPSPWKVCMERDKPLCLYRNCISFIHKCTPGIVTLVDMFSYIQVHVEAMTKGYVETSVTKCLILGAAGVGKTHLKHLLLKKDPPEQCVSTGLADNPVRAISFTLAGMGGQEEDDLFVVEDDQALMSVIGETIKGGVSMAPSLADVVSTLPKMAISVPSDGAGVSHSDPIPADVNTTMDTNQQSRAIDIEDELIHHINNSSSGKIWFEI